MPRDVSRDHVDRVFWKFVAVYGIFSILETYPVDVLQNRNLAASRANRQPHFAQWQVKASVPQRQLSCGDRKDRRRPGISFELRRDKILYFTRAMKSINGSVEFLHLIGTVSSSDRCIPECIPAYPDRSQRSNACNHHTISQLDTSCGIRVRASVRFCAFNSAASIAANARLEVTTFSPSTSTQPLTMAELESSFTTSTLIVSVSPGKTGFKNRVRVVPTTKRRLFSSGGTSSLKTNRRAAACAIASPRSAPGIMAMPGKCPGKYDSLPVTFFRQTMRCFASNSSTRSMKMNGCA